MSAVKDIKAARLISSRPYQMPGKVIVTELFFEVPLDHARPEGSKLRIFCRSARKFEKPAAPKANDEPLPWFVYIPGGPGFGCPPPQNLIEVTNQVLDGGYQVSKEPVDPLLVVDPSVPLLRPSRHGSFYERIRRHDH